MIHKFGENAVALELALGSYSAIPRITSNVHCSIFTSRCNPTHTRRTRRIGRIGPDVFPALLSYPCLVLSASPTRCIVDYFAHYSCRSQRYYMVSHSPQRLVFIYMYIGPEILRPLLSPIGFRISTYLYIYWFPHSIFIIQVVGSRFPTLCGQTRYFRSS